MSGVAEHHRRLGLGERNFWGRCTVIISIARRTSASSVVAATFCQYLFVVAPHVFCVRRGGRNEVGGYIVISISWSTKWWLEYSLLLRCSCEFLAVTRLASLPRKPALNYSFTVWAVQHHDGLECASEANYVGWHCCSPGIYSEV